MESVEHIAYIPMTPEVVKTGIAGLDDSLPLKRYPPRRNHRAFNHYLCDNQPAFDGPTP